MSDMDDDDANSVNEELIASEPEGSDDGKMSDYEDAMGEEPMSEDDPPIEEEPKKPMYLLYARQCFELDPVDPDNEADDGKPGVARNYNRTLKVKSAESRSRAIAPTMHRSGR